MVNSIKITSVPDYSSDESTGEAAACISLKERLENKLNKHKTTSDEDVTVGQGLAPVLASLPLPTPESISSATKGKQDLAVQHNAGKSSQSASAASLRQTQSSVIPSTLKLKTDGGLVSTGKHALLAASTEKAQSLLAKGEPSLPMKGKDLPAAVSDSARVKQEGPLSATHTTPVTVNHDTSLEVRRDALPTLNSKTAQYARDLTAQAETKDEKTEVAQQIAPPVSRPAHQPEQSVQRKETTTHSRPDHIVPNQAPVDSVTHQQSSTQAEMTWHFKSWEGIENNKATLVFSDPLTLSKEINIIPSNETVRNALLKELNTEVMPSVLIDKVAHQGQQDQNSSRQHHEDEENDA